MDERINNFTLKFIDKDIEGIYQKIENGKSKNYRLYTIIGIILLQCITLPLEFSMYFIYIKFLGHMKIFQNILYLE